MSLGGKALSFIDSIWAWSLLKKALVGMIILAVIVAVADAL